eukprot:2966691-Rhodomonas_salina.4
MPGATDTPRLNTFLLRVCYGGISADAATVLLLTVIALEVPARCTTQNNTVQASTSYNAGV